MVAARRFPPRSRLRHGQLRELEFVGHWWKLKDGGMYCTLRRHSLWVFHIADSVQRATTGVRSDGPLPLRGEGWSVDIVERL